MKKSILFLVLLTLSRLTSGQDSISRRFELGSTLISVNTIDLNPKFSFGRRPVEFISGLFFRYTINRIGMRLLVGYSDNTTSYSPSKSGYYSKVGYVNNEKDWRMGIGGQYSIFKRQEWLYGFLDIAYRNVRAARKYYGETWTNIHTASERANGMDYFLGLGLKIRTFRNVFLSQEIGTTDPACR